MRLAVLHHDDAPRVEGSFETTRPHLEVHHARIATPRSRLLVALRYRFMARCVKSKFVLSSHVVT